jgi:hypothetical protein
MSFLNKSTQLKKSPENQRNKKDYEIEYPGLMQVNMLLLHTQQQSL